MASSYGVLFEKDRSFGDQMKKNRKRFFLKMTFNILCFVQLCVRVHSTNRPKVT